MVREGKYRLDWVLVAILTTAGTGLRLAYLLRVPPFLDEYSSILTGMSILHTGGIPLLPSGVLYPSGSIFSYLEALFIGAFGFSDFVARLPSLLVSGLTLPLLYVVAGDMLNRRVALLSVALLAFTPEAIVWGGRARMYALLQLLVLLTAYFFYRGVLDEKPGKDTPATPAWLWIPFFLAAIFTQDEAILLLPTFWLAALIVRWPRWFLHRNVLLGQVLLPLAGVGVRYWLNEIRLPGKVYTYSGVHLSFFRFPPAAAHGLKKIAPFFTAPWVWPVALFFLIALAFLTYTYYTTRNTSHVSRFPFPVSRFPLPASRPRPAAFLAYIVLAIAAAVVLIVNNPWQDDRYLFMVLPQFLMVASWGLDRGVRALAQRWPSLRSQWAIVGLGVIVALLALPGGLSAVRRYEPDYSAAYRWLATQLAADDLVATVRPAPCAVYLGRCDFLAAEDKHQEFIMRRNGEWIDRWAGAQVVESPEAFRDQVLETGRRVWFVIDEDRFESVAYSPEFVALILEQMELVYRDGGVLVFQGQGYQPPPDMAVTRSLDANLSDQLRLTGYALSTDRPEPGADVTLQLLWQAIQPERNYTVFVHVVGADGQRLTQIDGEPFLGLYGMTTHWPRDRAVTDTRRLTIPANTPPGRYRLEVGLYDASDVDAGSLPVLDAADNTVGDRLVLDFLQVDVSPPPEPSQPVEEGILGGVVRLVGYDPGPPLRVTAGDALPLTLIWECLAAMDQDYTVYVHLVDRDRLPLAQADGQPSGGAYPTSFWDVGERLADPRLLALPSDVPPGEYELRVGMYLLATGDRLSLLDESGQALDDGLSLGSVTVVSP